MAHKAGAPVIPLSIVNSHKVMPIGWMFAMKPSYGTAKVIVHEPVESVGRTEEELAEAVRESMISGLPDDQVPLKKKWEKIWIKNVEKRRNDESSFSIAEWRK